MAESRENEERAQMGVQNRRRLQLVAITVTLALCIYLAIHWLDQRLGEPRILGPLPARARLVSHRQFAPKPVVDLPWFGGRRLVYPTALAGSSHPHHAAGIMEWKDTGTVSDPKNHADWIQAGVWSDSTGAEYRLRRSWQSDYQTQLNVVLPFVYGNHPKTFQLTYSYREADKIPTTQAQLEVELPANGQLPPDLQPDRRKIGSWTLIVDPQPTASPWFVCRYAVSLENAKPDELFLAQIGDSRVLLQGSKPRTVTMEENGWCRVVINRVRQTQASLAVKEYVHAPGWPRRTFKLFYQGSVLATADQLAGLDCYLGQPFAPDDLTDHLPGAGAARIGNVWIGPDFDNGGNTFFHALSGNRKMMPLSDGQILDAVIYNSVEYARGAINLPDYY